MKNQTTKKELEQQAVAKALGVVKKELDNLHTKKRMNTNAIRQLSGEQQVIKKEINELFKIQNGLKAKI